MTRPKGGTNKYHSKEEKLRCVKMVVEDGKSSHEVSKEIGVGGSQVRKWVLWYTEYGESRLENKRKPGNPLAALHRSKSLTELERLQLENMKLRIENERLKKGYTGEEVEQLKKQSKKNMK